MLESKGTQASREPQPIGQWSDGESSPGSPAFVAHRRDGLVRLEGSQVVEVADGDPPRPARWVASCSTGRVRELKFRYGAFARF